MEFIVYRRRERGRVRSGTMITGPQVRGSLSVQERHLDEMRRTCRVATLCDAAGRPLSDPPPLYDATLIFAKSDLAGFEFVDTNGIMCGHAQTWWLIPAPVYDLERAEAARRLELDAGRAN